MAYFEWEARFDLGVGSMNAEHQVLFQLMNKLYELNAAQGDRGALRDALVRLEGYTVQHFAHEEAYQASIGYPGLESHKRVHRDLLAQLTEHKRTFLTGGGGLPPEFFVFLKAWLGAHIAGIDRKYANHAHAQRARSA